MSLLLVALGAELVVSKDTERDTFLLENEVDVKIHSNKWV